jgi:hypothetical protein
MWFVKNNALCMCVQVINQHAIAPYMALTHHILTSEQSHSAFMEHHNYFWFKLYRDRYTYMYMCMCVYISIYMLTLIDIMFYNSMVVWFANGI